MKILKKSPTFFIGIFLLSGIVSANALVKTPPQRAILPNGLKVIVAEDHSLPLVAASIVFRAGWDIAACENYEVLALLGLLRENADVKDEKRSTLREKLEAEGGIEVISSAPKKPFIACQGPTSSVEAMLNHIRKIAFELSPTSAQLDDGRKKLLQQMKENRLYPLSSKYLAEKAERLLWRKTGDQLLFCTPEQVSSLDQEKFQAAMDRYFVTNNAVLVVVGDVNASEIFKKSMEMFGKIPARDLVTDQGQCPLPQPLETVREHREYLDIKTTQVQIAFEAPGFADPDRYATELWQTGLAKANDSWVTRTLEKNFPGVTNIRVTYNNLAFGGALAIGFESQDPNVDRIIHFILQELGNLWQNPPGGSRLSHLVSLRRSEHDSDNEQRLVQAIDMGFSELEKDFSLFTGFGAGLEAVNQKDMARVAKRMFSQQRYSLAIAQPLASQDEKIQEGKRETLPNGLSVHVKSYPGSEVVGVCFQFDGGLSSDPPGKEGISALLGRYLNLCEFAGEKSENIREKLDEIGAKVNVLWAMNTIVISTYAPRKYLPQLLPILRDSIFHPQWSEALCRQAKNQLLNDQSSAQGDPSTEIFQSFFREAFPGTPLARGAYAPGTVANISLADLKAYHQKWIVPKMASLSIVGNINSEKAISGIKRVLEPIPAGNPPALPLNLAEISKPFPEIKEVQIEVTTLKNTAFLGVGYRVPTLATLLDSKNHDFPAIMVLYHILYTGGNNIVQQELIDTRLAQSKQLSLMSWGQGPGIILFSLQVPLEKLEEAKSKLKEILSSLHSRKISPETISAAAKLSDGYFLMSVEKSQQQAIFLASLMRIGVKGDLIEEISRQFKNLTPEMVKNTAEAYFRNFILITGKAP